MKNSWAFAYLFLMIIPINAHAETASHDRIRVDGNVLVYAGAQDGVSNSGDTASDAVKIGELLRTSSDITKVVLQGSFPSTGYALDVARQIEDFQLATEVLGSCTDACIYMFVAGEPRILPPGAKIGVRRRTVDARDLERSFDVEKSKYGWSDLHGQAAMMFDKGQSEMRWALKHLLRRGVSIDFGLDVFAVPREDMWFPSRGELAAAGVMDY